MLLTLPAPSLTQSVFGHPWGRTHGVDDFYGVRPHGRSAFQDYRHDHRYNDDYDGYFRHRSQAPCPRYQPIQLSEWKVAAGRQIVLEVALPGVQQENMRAWLGSDGSTIYVEGLRALPSRGRACLPTDASVTSDGRYEILEAAIAMPSMADAQRANMRRVRGGLRIAAPLRTRNSAMPDAKGPAAPSHVNTRQGIEQQPHLASQSRIAAEGSARVSAPASVQRSGQANVVTSTATERRLPVANKPVQATISLPPSTGIQVEDDDFPWPEKAAEASEGWLDNRGEFQFY